MDPHQIDAMVVAWVEFLSEYNEPETLVVECSPRPLERALTWQDTISNYLHGRVVKAGLRVDKAWSTE